MQLPESQDSSCREKFTWKMLSWIWGSGSSELRGPGPGGGSGRISLMSKGLTMEVGLIQSWPPSRDCHLPGHLIPCPSQPQNTEPITGFYHSFGQTKHKKSSEKAEQVVVVCQQIFVGPCPHEHIVHYFPAPDFQLPTTDEILWQYAPYKGSVVNKCVFFSKFPLSPRKQAGERVVTEKITYIWGKKPEKSV